MKFLGMNMKLSRMNIKLLRMYRKFSRIYMKFPRMFMKFSRMYMKFLRMYMKLPMMYMKFLQTQSYRLKVMINRLYPKCKLLLHDALFLPGVPKNGGKVVKDGANLPLFTIFHLSDS